MEFYELQIVNLVFSQKIAKSQEVTDYRLFVRSIIRHSDLVTKVSQRFPVSPSYLDIWYIIFPLMFLVPLNPGRFI